MSEDQNKPAPDTPKEDEIANYYDDVRKREMEMHAPGIRKARNALFITAGLLLLGEIITAISLDIYWTAPMVGIVVLEVGVFVGLALWTKTKPYTAIIIGLILFVLYWIASIMLVGIEGAYKGAIVKIIIIVTLVQAIKPAKAWEDLKKQG